MVHYTEYFYSILQTIQIAHLASLFVSLCKDHFVGLSTNSVSPLQREAWRLGDADAQYLPGLGTIAGAIALVDNSAVREPILTPGPTPAASVTSLHSVQSSTNCATAVHERIGS